MNDTDFAPIVIGKLLNIGGMLEKKANQLLAPFNLNQQQFSLLFEIDLAGKVNQKAIVNRLVLEKAHVSKIIKKLSGLDLINVAVSPEDRRATWVTITPKGRALVCQCREVIDGFNQRWMAIANNTKLKETLDVLTELQRAFREI